MEKGNLMMIVIIVLLVFLLATVVGVAFFAHSAIANINQEAQTRDPFDNTPRVLRENEITRISIGDSIVTNLAADGGGSSGRMARVSVAIGYDNTQGSNSAATATLINEHREVIQSIVLAAIRNTTYEEMSDRYAMDRLSAEILQTLIDGFENNYIVAVTFTEWMLI